MPENAKPFVEVEFDILLNGSAEEPAAPTTAFAMCDWSSDGSSRAEEEQIDVGIDLKVLVQNRVVVLPSYLRDNSKVHVEMQVQRFDRNISSQTTILPFVAE